MTSGQFHVVKVDEIKVIPDTRQRKDIGDIGVLVNSIRRLGLIHPIVITRDYSLVAGFRRLTAIKILHHDTIACQYTDELPETTLKKIELEENVKRLDLSWQDEVLAVGEFHNLMCETEEHWTQEKSAEALGYSPQSFGERMKVLNEIRRGNDTILEVPKLSTARGIAERNESRRADAAVEQIHGYKVTEEEHKSIINADFTEWVNTYVGPKFNFVHCDFPYGINADQMHQGGSVATHGGYDDTEETYWRLLDVLCSNINKLCTESCHIMFWFSMHYYADTLGFFANHSDFIIDPFPLLWMKSDGVGLLPDPQRGPRRIYETCLFGSRGDRKIVSSVANAYAAPTDRTSHMSTKPEPVLRHFFRMFVDENSVVLDPTCGAGSALRAAESLGAAHILGVEINRDFTERADLALRAARRMKA